MLYPDYPTPNADTVRRVFAPQLEAGAAVAERRGHADIAAQLLERVDHLLVLADEVDVAWADHPSECYDGCPCEVRIRSEHDLTDAVRHAYINPPHDRYDDAPTFTAADADAVLHELLADHGEAAPAVAADLIDYWTAVRIGMATGEHVPWIN